MRVSELQLNFARERAAVISAVIPKESHTCIERSHLPCFMCNCTSRVEMSQDENGVLCDIFLGDNLIERFYADEFMP